MKLACLRPSLCRRSGLTLIELLVAISVIGTLLSLLFPAVQCARNAARNIECKNNLKNIAFATLSFANAHNGRMPYLVNTHGTAKNVSVHYGWVVDLMPYMDNSAMYRAIENWNGTADSRPISETPPVMSSYLCPLDHSNGRQNGGLSFIANAGYMHYDDFVAIQDVDYAVSQGQITGLGTTHSGTRVKWVSVAAADSTASTIQLSGNINGNNASSYNNFSSSNSNKGKETAEEKARKEAEEKARKEAEEKAQKEAKEKEEREKKEKEEKEKKEKEEREKKEKEKDKEKPTVVYSVNALIAHSTGVFWRNDGGPRMNLDWIQNGDGQTQTYMFSENMKSNKWFVGAKYRGTPGSKYGPQIGTEDVGFGIPVTSAGSANALFGTPAQPLSLGTFAVPDNSRPTNAKCFNVSIGNYARPSSNHFGTVNMAYCDGRVEGLSVKINGRVYATQMTPNGQRYGQ